MFFSFPIIDVSFFIQQKRIRDEYMTFENYLGGIFDIILGSNSREMWHQLTLNMFELFVSQIDRFHNHTDIDS